MRATFRLLLYLSSIVPLVSQAQVRAPAGREFQITKIGFESWSLRFIWNLDFGIWNF